VTTGDGRSLTVRTAGPDATAALLLLTGTPSGSLPHRPIVEAAAARGLRFVTYQRPGYGDSTRLRGRSVGDCAKDLATVAAALGVERAYVAGWSGGGPHALACATLLPDLVASAATLAGVAPHDAAGLDWTAGMGPENVAEFGLARAGEDALRPYLVAQAETLARVTGDEVAEALGGLVTAVDRAALTDELAAYLAAEFREAVRTGIEGWLDDDLAFTRDWGFGLDAPPVPVTVWQGDEDLMVPFAHGEWLAANVGGAAARLLPGVGHISLVERIAEIVDDLVARGR
jgi:pimeloyl-ACP methyl ester carboxylesterase